MTLPQRRKAYTGKSVVFMGYDGKIYDGVICDVWQRGVSVEYRVTLNDGATRLCTANLLTADAKKRLVVQS